jgi:hypothetical protein
MAENLKTTKFRNGKQMPDIMESSEWWEGGAAIRYKRDQNLSLVCSN